ncbi:MAG: double zinc ribbon domain-containing protein [Methyloceanibacter sp.]
MGNQGLALGDLMGEAGPAPAEQSAVEEGLVIHCHRLACFPCSPSRCIIGPMSMSEAQFRRSHSWRAAFGVGLDLLLRPVCIACRARVSRHGLVCGACFAGIDFIAPPICDRLGVPLPFDTVGLPIPAGLCCRRRQSPRRRPTTARGPWRATLGPCAI